MGEHGESVSEHSSATTHNDASGTVHGPMVQTGSIGRDLIVVTETTKGQQWWRKGESEGRGGLSDIDEWAEGLAQGVKRLRQDEERQSRVRDPAPLPVHWHPAPCELSDHWANIGRFPAGAHADPLPLTGRIEQLAEIYRRVPSRRLVLLGPAGAGKTVLATRLALDLLKDPRPGEPVPVIVSAGSWNPTTTSLHAWLSQQIIRDHPGLATRVGSGGVTRADALLAADRVLPVLDGFDEMATGLHEDALRQLNETPDDVPMVITSRVAEYTAAVRDVEVLSAAAVVELDTLSLEDLAAYLPRTAAGHRTGIWDPVLEQMRARPHEPGPAMLREVLTNPLMVFLARTIYSDKPRHDPAHLLDADDFPTPQALQDHFLADFVPAVYRANRPDHLPRWPYDRSHRYLTYLAGHLHRAETHDLAWWQIRDTLPRWRRTLVFAVVDGLLVGLAFGLGSRLSNFLWLWLVATLASGLTVALTVGLIRGLRIERLRGKPRLFFGKLTIALGTGLGTAVPGSAFGPGGVQLGVVAAVLAVGFIGLRSAGPQPTRTRLQVRGQARLIFGRFAAGFTAGSTAGLLLGRVIGGLDGALVFGIMGGTVIGLAIALALGLEAPANAADVASAGESLARDRRNTIRKIIAIGLPIGLMVGLMNGVVDGYDDALAIGLPVAVVVGFMSVRASSAWLYWLVLVRGWLPLTGRLPWGVQGFLADACERGVLRQTGAVYQFRHARLQHHLTDEAERHRHTELPPRKGAS